jgi:hypothetical protein
MKKELMILCQKSMIINNTSLMMSYKKRLLI